MELTHGSLFAGIGGFDLGFERAGFKTVWQVEIDDYATKVLAKNFPHAQRFRDIKTVGRHNLAVPTVVSGGFPCQDISNAGKRAGLAGSRSGLWVELRRLIDELRPAYVVVENVAALYQRGLSTVLGDLATCGYDAEWDCLPAAAFGAPHLRERIFIVAHSHSGGLPRQSIRQEQSWRTEVVCSSQDMAHATKPRLFPALLDKSAAGRSRRGRFSNGSSENSLAHTRLLRPSQHEIKAGGIEQCSQKDIRHSASQGLPNWAGGTVEQPFPLTQFERPSGREIERDFRGMAHGVSNRVDRLKCLGNAVIPQIAEFIAWQIRGAIEAEPMNRQGRA